jgi:hypothetical protein
MNSVFDKNTSMVLENLVEILMNVSSFEVCSLIQTIRHEIHTNQFQFSNICF